MRLAKATPEDVEAMRQLMRVLNAADDENFPCRPDGTWDENDGDWFDVDDEQHLRKFYDRVMGCIKDHPGAVSRVIGGFHLAMHNGVFDPNADVLAPAGDKTPTKP